MDDNHIASQIRHACEVLNEMLLQAAQSGILVDLSVAVSTRGTVSNTQLNHSTVQVMSINRVIPL